MNDCSQQEQQAPAGEKPVGSPWMKKLGILLVALSFVLYGGILLVAIYPLCHRHKSGNHHRADHYRGNLLLVGCFAAGKRNSSKIQKIPQPTAVV